MLSCYSLLNLLDEGKILLLDKVRTDLLLGSFFILDRFVSIERDYKFSFILI